MEAPVHNVAVKDRVEENFKINSKEISDEGGKDNTNRDGMVKKRTTMCFTFNAEDRVKGAAKEKTTKAFKSQKADERIGEADSNSSPNDPSIKKIVNKKKREK